MSLLMMRLMLMMMVGMLVVVVVRMIHAWGPWTHLEEAVKMIHAWYLPTLGVLRSLSFLPLAGGS